MENKSMCALENFIDNSSGMIDSFKEDVNDFDNGDFPVAQMTDEDFISQDQELDLKADQLKVKTDLHNEQIKRPEGIQAHTCHICNTTSSTSVGLKQHIMDFHSG